MMTAGCRPSPMTFRTPTQLGVMPHGHAMARRVEADAGGGQGQASPWMRCACGHATGAATAGTCTAPQPGATHALWGDVTRLPRVPQVHWQACCALSLWQQDAPAVLWWP